MHQPLHEETNLLWFCETLTLQKHRDTTSLCWYAPLCVFTLQSEAAVGGVVFGIKPLARRILMIHHVTSSDTCTLRSCTQDTLTAPSTPFPSCPIRSWHRSTLTPCSGITLLFRALWMNHTAAAAAGLFFPASLFFFSHCSIVSSLLISYPSTDSPLSIFCPRLSFNLLCKQVISMITVLSLFNKTLNEYMDRLHHNAHFYACICIQPGGGLVSAAGGKLAARG